MKLSHVFPYALPYVFCMGIVKDVHGVHKEVPACDDSNQLHGMQQEVQKIDVSEITPELFHERYVRRNLPVIVRGAAGNIFLDAASWTVEGLLANPVSRIKQRCLLSGANSWGQLSRGKWGADRLPNNTRMLDLHELVEYPTRAVLFRTVPFKLLWPAAAHWDEAMSLQRFYFAKLRQSNMLQHTNTSIMEPSFFNLHVSNQGGAMPHLHDAVMNVLFQGTKKWILFDPLQVNISSRTSGWKRSRRLVSMNRTSQEWFADPHLRTWRSRVPHYEFDLHEGEGLFIPEGWVHATMDLTKITVGAVLKSQVVHSGFEFSMSDQPGHERVPYENASRQYVDLWPTAGI